MGRYAILVGGKVANIVKADAETAAANGWVEAVGKYKSIHVVPVVPQSVSMAQARKALLTSGITAAMVADAIDAITDETDKAMAEIDWEYSTTVNRSSPWVASLGAALGLAESDVDDLFTAAAAL
jgi:hypothetical protein